MRGMPYISNTPYTLFKRRGKRLYYKYKGENIDTRTCHNVLVLYRTGQNSNQIMFK